MFVYRIGRMSYPDGYEHKVKALPSAAFLESLRPTDCPSRFNALFATPVLEEVFRWVGIKDFDSQEDLIVWKIQVNSSVKVFNIDHYDEFCHSFNYGSSKAANAFAKTYWEDTKVLSSFKVSWNDEFSEVMLLPSDVKDYVFVSYQELLDASYSGNPVVEYGCRTDEFLEKYEKNFK